MPLTQVNNTVLNPANLVLTTAVGLPLATGVTGTLPVALGGTNNAALAVTAGGVLYTDGSKVVNVGAGTTGQVLLSQGAGAPIFATAATGLGDGQTWQNVTGSRASNTTYTNSTGKPIMITIYVSNAYPNTQNLTVTIGGVTFTAIQITSPPNGFGTTTLGHSYIVPTGATYSATISGYSAWFELR